MSSEMQKQFEQLKKEAEEVAAAKQKAEEIAAYRAEQAVCTTEYHKFVIIAMYNHEDEDKEFKTLGEAKAYCENFLNYHYNDIQRLHRDDINDGEWSYENDWFDEEWQQKEGEENE